MSARVNYRNSVEEFLNKANEVLAKYYRREISKEVWLEQLSSLVGEYHVKAANLGRELVTGVPDNFSIQDFEIGNNFAIFQQQYLSDFYAGLEEYTEEDAAKRLNLYQYNLRGTANHGWLATLFDTETRWVTTANESCVDCLFNASLGYIPAANWPIAPGSIGLECAMKCKCYFRLRNGKTGLKYVEL